VRKRLSLSGEAIKLTTHSVSLSGDSPMGTRAVGIDTLPVSLSSATVTMQPLPLFGMCTRAAGNGVKLTIAIGIGDKLTTQSLALSGETIKLTTHSVSLSGDSTMSTRAVGISDSTMCTRAAGNGVKLTIAIGIGDKLTTQLLALSGETIKLTTHSVSLSGDSTMGTRAVGIGDSTMSTRAVGIGDSTMSTRAVGIGDSTTSTREAGVDNKLTLYPVFLSGDSTMYTQAAAGIDAIHPVLFSGDEITRVLQQMASLSTGSRCRYQ
jgi:hypothetical protein